MFSNFDGVMATDFALQDKRQADGAPFHYIVTLFHLPFLEARDRVFHTTRDSLPLLLSGSRCVWIRGEVAGSKMWLTSHSLSYLVQCVLGINKKFLFHLKLGFPLLFLNKKKVVVCNGWEV